MFFCRAEEATEVLGSKPIVSTEHWEQNSVLLLEEKLQHLEGMQKKEMLRRLSKYPSVFDSLGESHIKGTDNVVADWLS